MKVHARESRENKRQHGSCGVTGNDAYRPNHIISQVQEILRYCHVLLNGHFEVAVQPFDEGFGYRVQGCETCRLLTREYTSSDGESSFQRFPYSITWPCSSR